MINCKDNQTTVTQFKRSFWRFTKKHIVLLATAGLIASFCDARESAVDHNFHYIRVPAQHFKENSTYRYFVDALRLALDKTKDAGLPFKILPDPSKASQGRLLRQLREGTTDVTWTVTSREREHAYRAVYFPIARGLFGYRVLLIHTNNNDVFANLSLSQLKENAGVQGVGWPDATILRFNGYSVKEAPVSMLFKLIESKMADYFPRSVLEVEDELSSRTALPLMIEPQKAFYYLSPLYYYVSRQNSDLADRIQKGLDIALADGSLLALYNDQPFAKSTEKLLSGRDFIELKNPVLSDFSQHTLEKYSTFLIKK